MEANKLHREAALLSNTLHTYRDDDVEGVKPVIDQILSVREKWKLAVGRLEHYVKFGKLPDEPDPVPVEAPILADLSKSDLKVQLQQLNVNITKYKKKIDEKPQHSKSEYWKEELAKMEALKLELKEQIVLKRHETA
ncbi:MAG: hypothetical protein LCH91_05490 [Bacteroidetes bacterium]|nr:hypothetical protein [Bacteroidota bacterium]